MPSRAGYAALPTASFGERTIAAAAINTTDSTAATRNAVCTPCAAAPIGAVPSPSADSVPRVIIVTNSAVPAAPATCCTVLTVALPLEYNSAGSDPSAEVINGVRAQLIPALTITCAAITRAIEEWVEACAPGGGDPDLASIYRTVCARLRSL